TSHDGLPGHDITLAGHNGIPAYTRAQRRMGAHPVSKGELLWRHGRAGFASSSAAIPGAARTFREWRLSRLRKELRLQSFWRAADPHEGLHNGAVLLE